MYIPITIDKIERARYVIRHAAEGLLAARFGMDDLRSQQKQNRTITYRLYCQIARRQAEELLKGLPSDEQLDRLIK